MRAQEFTESSCKRTRARECSCGRIKSITEGETTVIAQCELQHSDAVKGNILFMQAPGTPTLIKGTITGLEPGEHGFHIHEFGDMSKGCESMGGHYNITADENGTANFSIQANRVDLIGDRSVVGRGIVVHADPDDLGRGGDEESKKTGNAGDRLACGVITLRSTK
jgi:Cu-Zn family superoxide dismutase